MLSLGENFAIIVATVLVSLLAMVAINLVWPKEKRRQHNDLIGWQLSILGTTYAVILGFMLYNVWTSFGAAELNAHSEANAVVDIFHVANGLPEPQRTQLQELARSYIEAVVSQEWPKMGRGETPEETTVLIREMWRIIISANPVSPAQVTAQDHAMTQLEALSRYRLGRIAQSRSRLPGALWCVLLVGGLLTIGSSCTFGTENTYLQILQVFCLSLLISLTLVSIIDVHRPYQGAVHVSDYAFQRARDAMQVH